MRHKSFYIQRVLGVEIIAATQHEIDALGLALRFIKRKDPAIFKKFERCKAILVYPKKGYDNAVYRDDDPGIWVCESGTVLEASREYLAGLLVHETHHMAQWARGIRGYGERVEDAAYRAQRRFLVRVGAPREDIEWLDTQRKEKWWVVRKGKGKQSYSFPNTRHRKLLAAYRAGTIVYRRHFRRS